jgi:large conductance mechanosensitive channel
VFNGFKNFVLRGNVVDLAVAVVIGAAFTTIVTAFTDHIIQPLINAITPPQTPGLGVSLIAGKQSTYIDFAAVISATINFLIVAAVVYFVIVYPLTAIKARRERGAEPGPAEPTDVELLKEIRDLLAAQVRDGSTATSVPTGPVGIVPGSQGHPAGSEAVAPRSPLAGAGSADGSDGVPRHRRC